MIKKTTAIRLTKFTGLLPKTQERKDDGLSLRAHHLIQIISNLHSKLSI